MDIKLFSGDDLDFYENYLQNLTDEELKKFYEETPEFMKDYNMYEGRLFLLKDPNYRAILRRMKNNIEQPTVKE